MTTEAGSVLTGALATDTPITLDNGLLTAQRIAALENALATLFVNVTVI